ncbi:MAG TPA: hypothetical protein VFF77_03975, partial [Holophagaceae bacterium]|nr:hypothetical protein [Holophagaceae bacterium]
ASARAAKAQALKTELAALYAEVRAMREGGKVESPRLEAIRIALKDHPEDWLLKQEIEELSRPVTV